MIEVFSRTKLPRGWAAAQIATNLKAINEVSPAHSTIVRRISRLRVERRQKYALLTQIKAFWRSAWLRVRQQWHYG